jgi:DNA end-binding protein Ku
MEALRRSVGQAAPAKAPKKPKKATGQKEMLLPIAGKKKEAATKKPAAKLRYTSQASRGICISGDVHR